VDSERVYEDIKKDKDSAFSLKKLMKTHEALGLEANEAREKAEN